MRHEPLGGGKFVAFSAGSHPRGEVHPTALELLQQLGYSTAGLRNKSWDEFAKPESPPLDFVFTVCDAAAGESCPFWPGRPMTAHWGVGTRRPSWARRTRSDACSRGSTPSLRTASSSSPVFGSRTSTPSR